jgi:hypothetical protein
MDGKNADAKPREEVGAADHIRGAMNRPARGQVDGAEGQDRTVDTKFFQVCELTFAGIFWEAVRALGFSGLTGHHLQVRAYRLGFA